jgi:hypothetical protein
MESMETTRTRRTPFAKMARRVGVGVLAAAALSVSAASALTVAPAAGARDHGRVWTDSHRLALSLHADSLRLT